MFRRKQLYLIVFVALTVLPANAQEANSSKLPAQCGDTGDGQRHAPKGGDH